MKTSYTICLWCRHRRHFLRTSNDTKFCKCRIVSSFPSRYCSKFGLSYWYRQGMYHLLSALEQSQGFLLEQVYLIEWITGKVLAIWVLPLLQSFS